MYYNQELGLCIEFGPVRVDSVRRGGGPPPPGSNPPCAGSRRHGLLPGLLVIACYLSFTPSSLKYSHFKGRNSLHLPRNQSAKTSSMSVLRLPGNLHVEVKPLRSPALATKSRLWTIKTRGFPGTCIAK